MAALNASTSSMTPGAARSHTGMAGMMHEISTGGVAPRERLDFWHHAHLNRMSLSLDTTHSNRPFDGRLIRILGNDTHLMDHASDAISAMRNQRQRHRPTDRGPAGAGAGQLAAVPVPHAMAAG